MVAETAAAGADGGALAEVAGAAAASALGRESDAERARSPAPLLIVGAPRSGATLLSAALGRHPRVAVSGDEHRLLGDLVADATIPFFASAPATELAAVGAAYAAAVAARAGAGAETTYAVDRDLENAWWLGAADRITGGTFKALVVRRDARAVAFSCFKTGFGADRAWADDVTDLGARLRAIRALEDHWLSVLPPDRVRVVSYEALIDDPAATLGDVLDWLGVDGCERCLLPNATATAFTSAAAAAIRGPPFHGKSLLAWKHYAAHLEEGLLPALNAGALEGGAVEGAEQ